MFVGGKNQPRLSKEYEEVRRLRRGGRPIKRIAQEVGVSPGTVHRWTTDIALTEKQQRGIETEWRTSLARINSERSERCRQARLVSQLEGRARAREDDGLHRAGCMLYWAEGAKSRNVVAFSNSEIAMVVYFKRFLVREFDLGPDRFTMRLNVHLGNGLSLQEIEATWLSELGLEKRHARKDTVNDVPRSSSRSRKNHLIHGVCTLKVTRSTPIIQHIYGAIQEYGGFDEPGWLG